MRRQLPTSRSGRADGGAPGRGVGCALFFSLAPATVAGLVPWGLTGWRVGATLPGTVAPARPGDGPHDRWSSCRHSSASYGRARYAGPGRGDRTACRRGLAVTLRNPIRRVIPAIAGQALLWPVGARGGLVACLPRGRGRLPRGSRPRPRGTQYEQYRRAVPWLCFRLRPNPAATRGGSRADRGSGGTRWQSEPRRRWRADTTTRHGEATAVIRPPLTAAASAVGDTARQRLRDVPLAIVHHGPSLGGADGAPDCGPAWRGTDLRRPGRR
jgi:hypothetical protein